METKLWRKPKRGGYIVQTPDRSYEDNILLFTRRKTTTNACQTKDTVKHNNQCMSDQRHREAQQPMHVRPKTPWSATTNACQTKDTVKHNNLCMSDQRHREAQQPMHVRPKTPWSTTTNACQTKDTVKHILIECTDVVHIRKTFYSGLYSPMPIITTQK